MIVKNRAKNKTLVIEPWRSDEINLHCSIAWIQRNDFVKPSNKKKLVARFVIDKKSPFEF